MSKKKVKPSVRAATPNGTKKRVLKIEWWPIDRLEEYSKALRIHSAAAVDRMCGSFRQFELKIPLLVRSSGEVIDGHLRLKAARECGITQIPVVLCDE